MQKAQR